MTPYLHSLKSGEYMENPLERRELREPWRYSQFRFDTRNINIPPKPVIFCKSKGIAQRKTK